MKLQSLEIDLVIQNIPLDDVINEETIYISKSNKVEKNYSHNIKCSY